MLSPVTSTMSRSEFSPDWAIAPGEILQAELDARGLTQAELAARTNLSTKHVNQVVKGVASLSPDTALRLERALGIPSGAWNRLEAIYQDHRARQKARDSFTQWTAWLRLFPLRELIDREVLATDDDEPTRIEKLLSFFRVADPDAYDKVWAEPVAAGFRRAQYTDVDPYATALWLRLGERSAEARPCAPYDARGFAELLPRLRELTLQPDKDAFKELQRQCAMVGVAVEYEPDVKGSRATGVATWLGPAKAMILLSGRYRYHDIFWFSFFHEAAHLLLHPKRKAVVHLENNGDDADGQESTADDFAASTLVPSPHSERLTAQTTVVETHQIAHDIGVHPGIVAGRLCHLHGNWKRYAKLRRKLESLRD
jgi:HTH-type transcriptional regulator/antitoxin HigA